MKTISVGRFTLDAALLEDTNRVNQCQEGGCQGLCCHMGCTVASYEADRILKYSGAVKAFLPQGKWQDEDAWLYAKTLNLEPEDDRPAGPRTWALAAQVRARGEHAVLNRYCVFYNGGCTLQQAANRLNLHPWSIKPLYCWLFPLNAEKGVITWSKYGLNTCLNVATDEKRPAYTLVEKELRYLLGDQAYDRWISTGRDVDFDDSRWLMNHVAT